MIHYLINAITFQRGYLVHQITKICILIQQDIAYLLFVCDNSNLSQMADCSVYESYLINVWYLYFHMGLSATLQRDTYILNRKAFITFKRYELHVINMGKLPCLVLSLSIRFRYFTWVNYYKTKYEELQVFDMGYATMCKWDFTCTVQLKLTVFQIAPGLLFNRNKGHGSGCTTALREMQRYLYLVC